MNFPRFREGYLLNNKYMQPNRNKSDELYKTCQKNGEVFQYVLFSIYHPGLWQRGTRHLDSKNYFHKFEAVWGILWKRNLGKNVDGNGAKLYDIGRYIMGTFSRLQQ